MKILVMAIMILNMTAFASIEEGCNPKKSMCKFSPCVSAVVESVGSITASSCNKVYKRSYEGGDWEFLYYELDVVSSVKSDNSTYGNKIRLKDLK